MKLIAGIIPNEYPTKVRHWEWTFDHKPNGYAIVKSRNDYTLVRIVGVTETEEPKLITGGHKVRQAVLSVPTKLLEMAEPKTNAEKFKYSIDDMLGMNPIEEFDKINPFKEHQEEVYRETHQAMVDNGCIEEE